MRPDNLLKDLRPKGGEEEEEEGGGVRRSEEEQLTRNQTTPTRGGELINIYLRICDQNCICNRGRLVHFLATKGRRFGANFGLHIGETKNLELKIMKITKSFYLQICELKSETSTFMGGAFRRLGGRNLQVANQN